MGAASATSGPGGGQRTQLAAASWSASPTTRRGGGGCGGCGGCGGHTRALPAHFHFHLHFHFHFHARPANSMTNLANHARTSERSHNNGYS